jgi:hypothetical protein
MLVHFTLVLIVKHLWGAFIYQMALALSSIALSLQVVIIDCSLFVVAFELLVFFFPGHGRVLVFKVAACLVLQLRLAL